MSACRCDPTQVKDRGVATGQPHKPVVFRTVLRVNGVSLPGPVVLHCRRCLAVWRGR